MFSTSSFHRQYDIDTADLVIRDRRFRFFVPRSIDPFLNDKDVFHEFPLWAKIWEASLVLADYLAAMPVDPGRRLLEIGCGVGVVGIVAAAFGHRVTLTEYDPNALQFTRANAHANLSANNGAGVDVIHLDWNQPELAGRFDVIVGSEVIYKETDFEAIVRLFETLLSPSGKIILAEGIRKTTMAFFSQASVRFDIEARRKTLRSRDKDAMILLAKMGFRSAGQPLN